jgi:uncharacterized membrane protein YbhN (UPF0104 family)
MYLIYTYVYIYGIYIDKHSYPNIPSYKYEFLLMSSSICMYVCMYLCIYVCMYANMYVYDDVHVYIYVCMYIIIFMQI